MDEERFRELVGEAIDSIPSEFGEKLNNVAVIVEDSPTPQQLRKLRLPPWALLFGLYEGIPQTKRGSYFGVLPHKITIFSILCPTARKNSSEANFAPLLKAIS